MCRLEQLQHFRDPGCSIGSSRRKSRLWRNYHAARDFIVTEEVPCRGPGKRATRFAKCLVHVGTILAHLAATSFYQLGDLGEHRLTTWKKKEVPPNTTSRWHPRARHVVVILRHKTSWKPESHVRGLAVEACRVQPPPIFSECGVGGQIFHE